VAGHPYGCSMDAAARSFGAEDRMAFGRTRSRGFS
jgi:hypothetical protein